MHSRRIVGWAVSATLHTAGLPLLALEHALLSTGASHGHQGLVHHSDRGSQYVSLAYSDALITAGVSASVGTVGDSYDNALAETVNGLYKAELIHSKRLWESPRRSSWPRWGGCTGGTPPACTRPWATALPWKSRRPTLTIRIQRPLRPDLGTKPRALQATICEKMAGLGAPGPVARRSKRFSAVGLSLTISLGRASAHVRSND